MNVDVWNQVYDDILKTYGSEWYHTEDYPAKDSWKLIDLDGNLYQITSLEGGIDMMTYGPLDNNKKWRDIYPISLNPDKFEQDNYPDDDYPPPASCLDKVWNNIIHPFRI